MESLKHIPVEDVAFDDLAPTAAATSPGLGISERARHALPMIARPYTLDDCRNELQRIAAATPTGFDMLHDVGLRWVPGTITGVIARPGAGKTQFLIEACARYLEQPDTGHAVFLSWEESPAALVLRLIQRADARMIEQGGGFSGEAIPNEAVRSFLRGETVSEQYRARIESAVAVVDPLLHRLRIIGGANVGSDVEAVVEALAAWMREPDAPRVGLVAVDYFQQLGTGDWPGHSRQDELRRVANTLLKFALGSRCSLGSTITDDDHPFAVPVIIGAQVNRAAKQSSNDTPGHPTGDDIREADDLLNVANAIIGLSWVAASTPSVDHQRFLRVSVPKHRSGRTRGTFGDEVARVAWRPARAWIANQCEREPSGAVEWAAPENAKDASAAASAKGKGKPTPSPELTPEMLFGVR